MIRLITYLDGFLLLQAYELELAVYLAYFKMMWKLFCRLAIFKA